MVQDCRKGRKTDTSLLVSASYNLLVRQIVIFIDHTYVSYLLRLLKYLWATHLRMCFVSYLVSHTHGDIQYKSTDQEKERPSLRLPSVKLNQPEEGEQRRHRDAQSKKR